MTNNFYDAIYYKSNKKTVDNIIKKVYHILKKEGNMSSELPENIVVELLSACRIKISFAESCTCGLLASMIGNVPGASAVFDRGFVTYSNEAKIEYLGVKPSTLDSHGAVSYETACEMAEGLRKKTGAGICAATTGIAGPDGGTTLKPVGLIYVGICCFGVTNVYKLNLKFDRNTNREYTACFTFFKIIEKLIEEIEKNDKNNYAE